MNVINSMGSMFSGHRWIRCYMGICLVVTTLSRVVGQGDQQPTDALLNALLEGAIIDANTGMGINEAVVEITGEVDKRIVKQKVGADGVFRFRLSSQQAYQITAQANGYASTQERLAFTSQYTNRLYGKRIRLTPLATREDIKPVSILFAKRNTNPLPQAETALITLLQYLKANSTVMVELVGHTDNQGDIDLNRLLSEERAAFIAQFLLANGIAASRVKTSGLGSTRPLASNSSETTRQQNRRVEIIYH